jgi:2-dehydropantoate 2-reductase
MRGKIKNVALIGFGAMGSWFAPKLYRCLGNDHFAVIASGDRKKRLEEKGVSINNVNYKFNIIEPSKGKPVDLIIMAVKEMGLANAIKDIEKFVGKETQIMCVMNGVTSEDEIAAVYGYEHVLYSYMRVSIVMTAGVTNYDPNLGRVYVGEKVNDNENNGENHTQRVKAV